MGLFKKREKQLTSGSAWIDFLNIGDVDKSGLSEATYFACLKVLSEAVGKLPLKLMKEVKGGGVAPAYSNSKYQVCNSQPNKYMTATHFWGTVEFNRNHYGNAYVWIRVENKKLALYILPSNQIEIMIDDKGIWG
ncbi:MAG: phage portal protein, partial [Clostridia bacterium]